MLGASSGSSAVNAPSSCHARALGGGAGAAPSTTTRDLAAREIGVAARGVRASSASVPRYTVSNTFVSSRATAARRVAPNAALMSSERLGDAMRRLEEDLRARLGRELRETRAPLGQARRQESLEGKSLR